MEKTIPERINELARRQSEMQEQMSIMADAALRLAFTVQQLQENVRQLIKLQKQHA